MTFLGYFTSYGHLFFALMMDVYPGYSVSLLGSFVGLIYGFLDGFIGFYILLEPARFVCAENAHTFQSSKYRAIEPLPTGVGFRTIFS